MLDLVNRTKDALRIANKNKYVLPADRPDLMVDAGMLDDLDAQLLQASDKELTDSFDFGCRWAKAFGAFFAAGG